MLVQSANNKLQFKTNLHTEKNLKSLLDASITLRQGETRVTKNAEMKCS